MQRVSGFCYFVLVYSWFCDRALLLPSLSCFLSLLSVCLVSCGGVVFGSRQSCLVQVLVPGRGSDTHAPCSVLLWEPAVSSSLRLRAPLSACFVLHAVRVRPRAFSWSCIVVRSSFYRLHAMFLTCDVRLRLPVLLNGEGGETMGLSQRPQRQKKMQELP